MKFRLVTYARSNKSSTKASKNSPCNWHLCTSFHKYLSELLLASCKQARQRAVLFPDCVCVFFNLS